MMIFALSPATASFSLYDLLTSSQETRAPRMIPTMPMAINMIEFESILMMIDGLVMRQVVLTLVNKKPALIPRLIKPLSHGWSGLAFLASAVREDHTFVRAACHGSH
jgi:hypothetical protein